MSKDMRIFAIGTQIKCLAESYKSYVESTAEFVKGDVVLRAFQQIEHNIEEAEKLYRLNDTHEICCREKTKQS